MLKVNFTHLFVLLHRKSEFNDIYQLSAGFHFSQRGINIIMVRNFTHWVWLSCIVQCLDLSQEYPYIHIHLSRYISKYIFPLLQVQRGFGILVPVVRGSSPVSRWHTDPRPRVLSSSANVNKGAHIYKIVGKYFIILITFWRKKTLVAYVPQFWLISISLERLKSTWILKIPRYYTRCFKTNNFLNQIYGAVGLVVHIETEISFGEFY